MKYRTLGRTGLQVSEIGLGCEGFKEENGQMTARLIDIADQAGINLIDLYTPDPLVRKSLGEALKGRRDRFVLQAHLCSIWKNGQYQRTRDPDEVQEGFETMLSQLQTKWVDIGMIHYVDSEQDWQQIVSGPLMAYALQLKRQGRIRWIGLSSHNPAAAMTAVRSGLIDVLMFSVNPCYDLQPASEDVEELWAEKSCAKPLINMDPQREQLYELCRNEGVGITVMKVFGGGDLLDETLSPAARALSPLQCIHYALDRPGVASVLPGAHSKAQLQECLRYETAGEQEKDYAAALASFPHISWEGHCMYCGHCAPCPKDIPIASVIQFLNLAKAQGTVTETVREHYGLLKHKASECIQCHACERRCPFHVDITECMRQAAALFGKEGIAR